MSYVSCNLVVCTLVLLHLYNTTALDAEFWVKEESPLGTLVGKINKETSEKTLKLISPGNGFLLNERTGKLTTNRVFDRDSLTGTELTEGFLLLIESKGTELVHVRVFITDINDNKPHFSKSSAQATVREDIEAGFVLCFPEAVDRDEGSNAEIVYKIESDNDFDNFNIEEALEQNIKHHCLVRTEKGALDAETYPNYLQLNISACDKYLSNQCSYLKFIINIEDVNDNSPVFDLSRPQRIKIYENATAEKPIYQVNASDDDQGLNGELTYDIVVGGKEFAIDHITGEIYVVAKSLDAEAQNFFTLSIIATDKGDNPKWSGFQLNITVLDCNDESPVLQINPITIDQGLFNIVEGFGVGKSIGTLTITDGDSSHSNNQIAKVILTQGVEYFMLDDTHSRSFIGGKHTWVYTLKTKKIIDREKTPSIILSASARDNGSPSLSGSVNYTFTIDDVNDNSPVFEQTYYHASVNESDRIGKLVLRVTANDRDSAKNADISYDIVSKAGRSEFNINEQTGEIFLNDNVDRELHSFIMLNISARDHGEPPLTSYVPVNITIFDSNDNDPFFTSNIMTFEIPENSHVNTFIGEMKVHDEDILGTDNLRCSVVDTDFRVDPITCKLYANSVFDREKKHVYSFTATVTDGSGRKSHAYITVHVLDENDNEPLFPVKLFNISVHTNYLVGQYAAYIKANDLDVGTNNAALYSATLDDTFTLNVTTGGLKLNKNLLDVKDSKFNFKIFVRDRHGKLKNSDSAKVHLKVLPPSTQPPVFEERTYRFVLDENNARNHEIGKVQAKRVNSNSETFIAYSIKSGDPDNMFDIDEFGSLIAKQPIDHEKHTTFELVVEAADILRPNLVTNTSVHISIVDLNDNTPRFIAKDNLIEVMEGVPIGYVLYTCNVVDPDSGMNGRIKYTIKNTTGHFTIYPDSGEMRTNGSLDFETIENHVIYIQASDGGEPSLSSLLKLEIRIKDVNDNAPLFFNTSYVIRVSEDVSSGSVVLTVGATDADSRQNGDFFFALIHNEDSHPFQMLSNGTIILMKPLDRERKASYELRAVVQDYGNPPLESAAKIRVVVDDINDEAPLFEKPFYRFEVREEQAPGAIVGEVIAIDHDDGENGKFDYYLRDQHNFDFSTENRNGFHVCIIKTKKQFDCEDGTNVYNITLGASDYGKVGQTSEVTVQIVIKNINDHPPKFTQKLPYVWCAVEGSRSNVQILTVTAKDDDNISVPLEYNLVAFNDTEKPSLDLFAIDKTSGKIFTRRNLSNLKQRVYQMVVSVQEKSIDKPFVNYQKVVIFIVPKLSGAIFLDQCLHVSQQEHKSSRHILLQHYNKRAPFDMKNFRIVKQPGVNLPFSILANTGIISLDAKLNRNVKQFYQLNVTAEGHNNSRVYTDSVIVNIYVIPNNMYPPQYRKNPEIYTVLESIEPEIPFDTLKLPVDRDKGMEGTCIFSIEEPVDAPIRISPMQRRIMFTERIDREKKDKYVLRVRVHDLAEDINQRLSNTFTVSITIKDVNDNAPRFTSSNHSYVYEDANIGSIVANVVALDPDAGQTKTTIRYHIASGNEDDTFVLKRSTGALSTNKLLDIDKRQNFTLNIIAQELRPNSLFSSLQTLFKLNVEMIDVNNNPPKFSKEEYTAHVNEGMKIGTPVIRLSSTDADINPDYKAVIYELVHQDPGFFVDRKTGVIKTRVIHDREEKSRFTLDVLVKNTAQPFFQHTCVVHIIIDDINDNAPEFVSGTTSQIHIMENSSPGLFHKFVVVDRDETRNAAVKFSITHFEPSNDVFRLDKQSGQLFVEAILDREQRAKYFFQIEAINTSPPNHRCSQNVTVLVNDENDEDPVFVKRRYQVNISESLPLNTTIRTVKARDNDVGLNALIEYSIVNSTEDDGFGHFDVKSDTGDILLIAPLDYETKKSYTFRVKATGVGDKSYDVTTVSVNIEDENDNKPKFTQVIYEFHAKTFQSSPIGKVTATDADENGKQKVFYILRPPNGDFDISRDTGDIRIKNTQLLSGQYRLHVEAANEGYPPSNNMVEVLITFGDQDNSVIVFRNASVVFSLEENPLKGHELGQLVASSKFPGSITYRIVGTSNPQNAFAINLHTGKLFVNNSAVVDFEKFENFFLGVLATVGESLQQHSVFLHVLVNLTDVNDNSPFIYPPNSNWTLAESNHHPFPPELIYQFLVEDNDKIDQDRLTLNIQSGNEDGIFRIFEHNLVIVKNLDYETKHRHRLVVRVTDGGNPRRHHDLHIYLNVEDTNDNPPVFEKISPVSLSEATPLKTIVATVRATDVDTMKVDMEYGLERSNFDENGSKFAVDQSTGNVHLIQRLDYEVQQSYNLNISVFDGLHRSFGTLKIHVTDINDHEPRFSKSVYIVSNMRSSLKKGAFIIRVHANDLDHGDYGHVQYRLETPMDAFTIKQDSGDIIVNKPYKFPEGVDLVKLDVVAFDSYGLTGSKKSSALVELHVNRIKTPILKFTEAVYKCSVTERSPSGVIVQKVRAIFLHGIHREMSYRIINGNFDQAFTIGVHSGLLQIKNIIDGEKHSRFTLKIIAEVDNLSTTCIVIVKIVDINDNPPKFEKSHYVVSIHENVSLNTKLIQLKATDKDNPKQEVGNILYAIHSGQQSYEWLEINETSGWISTKSELDREKTSEIQLTIKATDLQGNGIHSFVSLNVTVLDINDNTPEFQFSLFKRIKVPENVPLHTFVFQANAIDRDEDENGRVSYQILRGSGIDQFYLNSSSTGMVYTNVTLDYEKASKYNLSVLAYDHGVPRKEHSFEYEINVIDVNEFQPKFTLSKFSFNIFANIEVGSEIGNVSATDEDGGDAGIVRFSIQTNSRDAFKIDALTGIITVKEDLRRKIIKNQENTRQRRDVEQQTQNSDEVDDNLKDVEELSFTVIADNGPNTTIDSTFVSVQVNYSCAGCVIETQIPPTLTTMKSSTIVIVLVSISVFILVLFVLCIAYFLRKKGCFNRSKNPSAFCKGKKDLGISSSVERELLNSGASSFDRLQQHFSTDHPMEKTPRVTSVTGLLQDGSGTNRSVSATDKASTFSFGVYHEQGIPESDMHTLGDTLSDITLKDFEQDSVFGYSADKMKSEPTKSLISRSTQESSLYSFSSNAHRNAFNFGARPTATKRITRRSDSHESLKDFMEEGGGEEAGGMDVGNLLYAKLAEVGEEEQDAIMDGVRSFREEGRSSHGGSFSTIVGSDEDLRRSYNYNYLHSWRPQYHPVNSVMSEIGRIAGGFPAPRPIYRPPRVNGHIKPQHPINYSYSKNDNRATLNSVKQPLINDTNSTRSSKKVKPPEETPLKTLNSGRTSMLSSVQSLPHTPQDMQSNYTSGALSPNFTPAITPLVFRSPSVSSIGTQENFPTQSKPTGYDVGFSNLRRAGSNVSQLSVISLSDLDISENEV